MKTFVKPFPPLPGNPVEKNLLPGQVKDSLGKGKSSPNKPEESLPPIGLPPQNAIALRQAGNPARAGHSVRKKRTVAS